MMKTKKIVVNVTTVVAISKTFKSANSTHKKKG